MANTFISDVIGDSDVEEEKRTTLLDVIEEKNRAANKKSLIHSMVIISKLKSHNHAEIAGHFEKLFRDVQDKHLCEGATGLLIFFPSHCLHVVEGALEILLGFVRELCIDEHRSFGGNMEDSKILVISHNIPARLYHVWAYTVQDIIVTNIDTYEPTESAEKVVTDLAVQLVRLGLYINKQPKNVLKTTLDTLCEKVPELYPQQGVVNYLVKTPIPCMTLPEDYLKVYDNPYDVHLAADAD